MKENGVVWSPIKPYYWPRGIPRQNTLAVWIRLFLNAGYQNCNSDSLEHGYEKIAIYASNNAPTHVARQLCTGRWTSKIGSDEDIEHELHDLVSNNIDGYGNISVLMKRKT